LRLSSFIPTVAILALLVFALPARAISLGGPLSLKCLWGSRKAAVTTAPPTPSMQKKRIEALIEQAKQAPKVEDGFKLLLQNETLIPRNGLVHVLGPGIKFMEWLPLLLLRPDLKVIVSELETAHVTEFFSRYNVTLDALKQAFPWLTSLADFNSQREFEAFVREKLVINRNAFSRDFSKHSPLAGQPIPKADLIIDASVKGTAETWHQHLKESGIIWVTTEYPPYVESFLKKSIGFKSLLTGGEADALRFQFLIDENRYPTMRYLTQALFSSTTSHFIFRSDLRPF
jgi:hypothetical protein